MGRKTAEEIAKEKQVIEAKAKAEAKTQANLETQPQAAAAAKGEPFLSQDEKDNKIIFENPDATPYELLQLGISQNAFEKLLTEGSNMIDKYAGGVNDVRIPDGGIPLAAIEQKTIAQQAADKMNDTEDTTPSAPLKPTFVNKITGVLPHAQANNSAKPVLSQATGGGVWVQNEKGGKQYMSQRAAQKLLRMDAVNFKIVNP